MHIRTFRENFRRATSFQLLLQRGLLRATLPNEIDDRTKKYFYDDRKKELSWMMKCKKGGKSSSLTKLSMPEEI